MASRGVNSAVPRWAVALVAAVIALLAIGMWREHRGRTTAEANIPFESARVIDVTFEKAVSLKVATLTGQVRSSASDAVLFGRIVNTQSRSYPYSVDYFVDLRNFGPGDMRWNARTRTMVVTVSDVVPATPNIDEARGSVELPKGLIVPRGSAQRLAQQTSSRAGGAVSKTANDPRWIAKARDSGREAVTRLVRAPLSAAGLGGVRVAVRYATEGGRSSELWDESTPLDVIVLAKP